MVEARSRIKSPAAARKGAKRLSGLAAAFISGFPAMALADGQGLGYGHGMMGEGWGWTGMIFGPVMMLAVLAIIVVAVVLIVRWLGGGYPSPQTGRRSPENAALDILKERFARGEIDKEEFEEKRRLLSD